MDQGTVDKYAEVLACEIKLAALRAGGMVMQAANDQRLRRDEGPAYAEKAFLVYQRDLEALHQHLREIIGRPSD